jgi:hypothetical protein
MSFLSRLLLPASLMLSLTWWQAVVPVGARPIQLDPQQTRALKLHFAGALENDPAMPGPGALVSGFERSTLVSTPAGQTWFMPLHVHYSGLSNKYCRLATAKLSTESPMLIALPTRALYDHCIRINGQFIIDVNDDGQPDVVQSIQVKSNRGNFNVTQAIVYLSVPGEEKYCYSATASSLLKPVDLRSSTAISAVIKRNKETASPQVLVCQ